MVTVIPSDGEMGTRGEGRRGCAGVAPLPTCPGDRQLRETLWRRLCPSRRKWPFRHLGKTEETLQDRLQGVVYMAF